MNVGLALLWIAGIFIIVLAVFLLLYFSYRSVNADNNIGPGFVPPPCSQSNSNLPDISNLACCFFNGSNSNLVYDRNFNMILAPFPTYFMDVCIGFCPTGDFDYTAQTCTTSDPVAQNQFNNCVVLLEPHNCQGSALPIAISNGILYYGFEATNRDCQLCCTCGQTICDGSACF